MKQTKIKTRGRTFIGEVISAKAQRTVTVQWLRRVYVPKYERYYQKKSKVKAHNPDEISAKEGDKVVIKECRPISKTKKFVVVEVLK
ncbi:MAG: 30S ribosomal protein S17 [Candidatus Woesearchaeota archaeon]